jgi:arylsulfatase A-like enzyme
VSADELEQTGLYCFFDQAVQALRRCERPSLLWLQTQGMAGPWDAPLPLRYQFADEDDPQPPDFVQPPELMLAEKFDPDQLLGFVHAYAGQVALADMCLGMLLDALDEHPLTGETLLVVTSPRGYPLGEHRRVGRCDNALYSELLHVPLLVRFPQHEQALSRVRSILQSHEVFALVAESCGWQDAGKTPASRVLRELVSGLDVTSTSAVAVAPVQRAIRTPAWMLRESQSSAGPRYELFAKPDDRWETNEVSSRCGEVVELLAAELDRFGAAARDGALHQPAPLADLLCDAWR